MKATMGGIACGALMTFTVLVSADAQALDREGACAGDRGAAFGLCLAYCSALKCDAQESPGNARACSKVGQLYYRTTGMQPPCVRPTCPCSSLNVTSILAANWVDEIGDCSIASNSSGIGLSYELLLRDASFDDNTDNTFFKAGDLSGISRCTATGTIDGEPIDEDITGLSEGELAECIRIIREAAQRLEGGAVGEGNNSCGEP